ncbi:choice-of-anchor H family protein [Alteromonas sp. 1_MG-2023]|uniref:choice-of-anchor H family protein n=1 Tax=Alteromonas sp. 1_MG-2023 TaxID=3062669 RepID=UPI0026E19BF8|nr:choice-of-anchor H family protein [Alteromonas sp. 1_MG-2023]MDO6567279.1 choice-of-anchor H family protein [Alteromonas sp. 1_MG-2023]
MKPPIYSLATLSLIALLPTLLPTASYAADTPANEPISVESTEYRYGAVYSASEALTETAGKTSNSPLSESAGTDKGTEINDASSKIITPAANKQATRESNYSGISKSYEEAQSATLLSDYWIYDSWVSLDTDIDYDGYYSEFTVEFDADTVFDSALVYAVIYLGRNDRYESIHVTSEFVLYGEDSSDSFVVESRLLSGFPAAEYDVLIEVYDAYSEELVAFSDGYDDADLAYLSLESDNHEYIYEDTVIVVEEHGGSTGLYSLFFIAFALVMRRAVKY